MRRRTIGVLAGAAVIAIGSGAILVAGPLSSSTQAQATPPPSADGTVERLTLNATTQVDGTLGYDGTYSIVNGLATSGGADPASLAQAYAAAQAQYDQATSARDALLHPKATDVANAQASLSQVSASLLTAQQAAAGATPHDIDQARAQLAQAQSQLASAEQAAAGASPAQLAQAQAQLAQAQAQLIAAQEAAAGPSAARLASAEAATTQASEALASDQASLTAAQAALGSACTASPTPTPDPTPAPTPVPCDLSALQLAVQQAQSRVTVDQAQLMSAQAALADLSSPSSQAEAQANLASAQAAVQSAQAALDALTSTGSQSLAQTSLASAQAAANAAQSALDAVVHGNPAQARAQLSAARAQVTASQASLYALRHPSAAQLKASRDAVATAAAQLAAAKGSVGAPKGVVTGLPEVGATVQPGGVLYIIDGTHPAVLLQGDVPEWRALQAGVADGPDVEQLETNLRDLGYGTSLKVDPHWDAETTKAVKAWQHALGLSETGVIPLGEVVFEPGPMRITSTSATLGATVQGGTAVLQATSTGVAVTIALDPALQTKVKVGDPVSVTLPDGTTTPGKISDVGTVATTPQGNDPNSTPTPTIQVTVTLDDPSVSHGLDQAPVTVNITTATATDVLAVPVSALVELLGGGYAVQVEESGELQYVGVQLGLFANGMVEVNGQGLAEGQHIVVAK